MKLLRTVEEESLGGRFNGPARMITTLKGAGGITISGNIVRWDQQSSTIEFDDVRFADQIDPAAPGGPTYRVRKDDIVGKLETPSGFLILTLNSGVRVVGRQIPWHEFFELNNESNGGSWPKAFAYEYGVDTRSSEWDYVHLAQARFGPHSGIPVERRGEPPIRELRVFFDDVNCCGDRA